MDKIKKEFILHRTSWKFFDRLISKGGMFLPVLQLRILIEILKELQFINDKKK